MITLILSKKSGYPNKKDIFLNSTINKLLPYSFKGNYQSIHITWDFMFVAHSTSSFRLLVLPDPGMLQRII